VPEYTTSAYKVLWSRRNPLGLKRLHFKGKVAFGEYDLRLNVWDWEKTAVAICIFCKFTALMISIITYALRWMSNIKKLNQVVMYSQILYFALAFQKTQFSEYSSCAAAPMVCSLQETETSTLIYSLFLLPQAHTKPLLILLFHALQKQIHMISTQQISPNTALPKPENSEILFILTLSAIDLYLHFHSPVVMAPSLYKCRKPDYLSEQWCSLSNKEVFNNR